ncbi:hypothetical protein VHEMI07781 [[Torrubiella] hemipterigena]|uniref:AAR2 family protein n=1 Tax=[Torrubiella] hemipterigena TaxID=1531966 RepID=A0A0A1TMB1_9HYPO|nr:hypothetical protein VHEMI07781 [[Torrubiella] hemipterigena]
MAAPDNRPLPVRLLTTESTASRASVDSVPVLGVHPLGSLQVHKVETPTDDGPPPLMEEGEDEMPGLEGTIHMSHELGGGDVVLVLDLPEVFTVGYDAVSFTAKHFGGVRDVPSGPHLFWVSHPSGMSARCGFWIESTSSHKVHVLQWDSFNEVLAEAGFAEARIQRDNLAKFHQKLISYEDPSASGEVKTAANIDIWRQLTGSIGASVLRRIGGADGTVLVHTGDKARGAVLLAGEMELERRFSAGAGRELGFSFDQRGKTYSAARFGAERSEEAKDATAYILAVMEEAGLSDADVVGEMQFAYMTGVHLGNESCIQQWWHMLLKLILKAYGLIVRKPLLVAALLRTLAAQIAYDQDWLDSSILQATGDSQSKDLRLALVVYQRRLDEIVAEDPVPDVLAVATALVRVEGAAAALGWDIKAQYLRTGKVIMEDGEEVEVEMEELAAEDERGEYAPEIVELDGEGRQKDLVSWSE